MVIMIFEPRASVKTKLIIAGVSILLIFVGVSMIPRGFRSDDPSANTPASSDDVLTPTRIGFTLSESAPIRLHIPAINVDAPFTELGLQPNGEIEVPGGYEEVGWYTKGPTPGEIGPAVVLGHVDSYQGPAVFFSLGQLKPGDSIEIERQDGKTAVFRVDYFERYPQSEFPTALIYGDLDYAGLRLITCSGIYDRETSEYNLNLVVYASLIDIKEPSRDRISID